MLGGGRLLGYFETPPSGNNFNISLLNFIGIVLLAPIVETFLLSGLLAALSPLKWPVPAVATLAGLVWGAAHGLVAPFWFFGTVFGFFVFSCSYLTWKQRSYWYGFTAAALPHAMQNLLVFSVIGLAE